MCDGHNVVPKQGGDRECLPELLSTCSWIPCLCPHRRAAQVISRIGAIKIHSTRVWRIALDKDNYISVSHPYALLKYDLHLPIKR